jgi:Cof subfamily protein (haloacid dehalogenase superfamily)
MTSHDRWLIALDIDGTLLTNHGDVAPEVSSEVTRVFEAGHEVMLATGRSWAETAPVIEALNISPEYVVCSNGAIVLKKDALADRGYRKEYVETFNPASVLTTIRPALPEGTFAVEDANGALYFTESFPYVDHLHESHQVDFDELMHLDVTRVVVISPSDDTEAFLQVVEKMGLHRVTYHIGYTAWLDIAPDGVNKATGLEKVREHLGIPRSRVFAAGDGRNDIEMLEWAAELGRGVAMEGSPPEVMAASNEQCASVLEHGLADALASI